MTRKELLLRGQEKKKASAEKNPKDFGKIGNRQGRRAAL